MISLSFLFTFFYIYELVITFISPGFVYKICERWRNIIIFIIIIFVFVNKNVTHTFKGYNFFVFLLYNNVMSTRNKRCILNNLHALFLYVFLCSYYRFCYVCTKKSDNTCYNDRIISNWFWLKMWRSLFIFQIDSKKFAYI